MGNGLPHLFSPIQIGPVPIKNRLYMTPHSLSYAEPADGDPSILLPGDRQAYYYAERATGGVGLIIQEGSMVHESSEYFPLKQPRVDDARSVPRLKRIVEMVHQHGAKIFLQLWHAGGHAVNRLSLRPTLAPSQIPPLFHFSVPKEMDERDITEVQEGFVRAAKNARDAGYDGVELHAGTSYLIFQFLSPFYNKRTDRYGGSLDNRMRFLLQTVDRVRKAIGNDMALGLRFISAELAPGGLPLEEGIEMAQRIESHGNVDFLDVEGVLTYHATPLTLTMYSQPHFNLDYIAPVKAATKKLSVLGNVLRLVDPQMAERFLAGGKMDMVGGARLFIADPHWGRKAQEGRSEEILSCIACNQFCFGNLNAGLPVGCVINPQTGREREWGEGNLVKAERGKRVLVVGGGPAGLEAARIAALRGHDVVLYEKEKRLGGQLDLAARLPGREVMATTIRWLERQLQKLGVSVVLGKEANPETVREESAEAVVVATGARYARTGLSGFVSAPVEGWDEGRVFIPEEVIDNKAEVGDRVLLYDDEGFVTALGLAELLLQRGASVRIVTRYPFVGPNLIFNFQLHPMLARLGDQVVITPNAIVKSLRKGRAVVRHLLTFEEEGIEPVDSLVVVTSKESLQGAWRPLVEARSVYAVGDCVSPAGLGEAVYDGHRVGRLL